MPHFYLTHSLICDSAKRLGSEQRGGAPTLKAHTFFRGVDFPSLRQTKAPFIPELKSITDTSYFPTDEIAHLDANVGGKGGTVGGMEGTVGETGTFAQKKDLAFVGYTFKRFEGLTRKNAL